MSVTSMKSMACVMLLTIENLFSLYSGNNVEYSHGFENVGDEAELN